MYIIIVIERIVMSQRHPFSTVSCFRRFVSHDKISHYFDRLICQRGPYSSQFFTSCSSDFVLITLERASDLKMLISFPFFYLFVIFDERSVKYYAENIFLIFFMYFQKRETIQGMQLGWFKNRTPARFEYIYCTLFPLCHSN
jgi:hypothetical protein